MMMMRKKKKSMTMTTSMTEMITAKELPCIFSPSRQAHLDEQHRSFQEVNTNLVQRRAAELREALLTKFIHEVALIQLPLAKENLHKQGAPDRLFVTLSVSCRQIYEFRFFPRYSFRVGCSTLFSLAGLGLIKSFVTEYETQMEHFLHLEPVMAAKALFLVRKPPSSPLTLSLFSTSPFFHFSFFSLSLSFSFSLTHTLTPALS